MLEGETSTEAESRVVELLAAQPLGYSNQRHRKCPNGTRMALSSCPILCSKSHPQEGGARKGRVPLLAFNPPKRWNSGPKPSSLHPLGPGSGYRESQGLQEGESSTGRKH